VQEEKRVNAIETGPPTWDLTSYFPSFAGPEMQAFKDQLAADLEALEAAASALDVLSAQNSEEWESVLVRTENVSMRLEHLRSFVGNLSSADAANQAYSAEEAALSGLSAALSKVGVDLMRGVRECSDDVFDGLIRRPALAGAEYHLQRLRSEAQHAMSRPEEKLAADLGENGLMAWGRLYDNVSGILDFEMRWPDGRVERLPISRWRGLMSDTDREIGRAAFEGGNRTWQTVEVTCAAALNGIAGWRQTLLKRRGWNHVLDIATFQNGIQRETLDALYRAIHENIDIPRSFFRAKAKALGNTGLAWYEREAPLPGKNASRLRSWNEGAAVVGNVFEQSYPKLAGYYRQFLAKGWLEAAPRANKRPGAYCTGSLLIQEERVYMTYTGTLGDITTLAHEVGHAWHSWLMRDQRPMAQDYPMTLAETASIFAEHILGRGLHADTSISDAEKLSILDQELSGAAIMLDITVRFEFEKAFYSERESGEVSVSRLKELMIETQRKVWGDALRPGGEDPYFWASKLHFYIADAVFYNFPYTFGFLLARSLSNMLTESGPGFLTRYEDFLRLTGSDTAENVARRTLGVDLGDSAFWATAIRSLTPEIQRYETLIDRVAAAEKKPPS
jgi:oligoendopeptidase F